MLRAFLQNLAEMLRDCRRCGKAAYSARMKYLAIIGAIVAAILLSQFLFDFYDWNKTQSCASTGGRNCGGRPISLSH
jgi:hypothetical protein